MGSLKSTLVLLVTNLTETSTLSTFDLTKSTNDEQKPLSTSSDHSSGIINNRTPALVTNILLVTNISLPISLGILDTSEVNIFKRVSIHIFVASNIFTSFNWLLSLSTSLSLSVTLCILQVLLNHSSY